MPTLGEMLNLGKQKLISVPEGFKLRKRYIDSELLSPNGIVTLSIFHLKSNGDLGQQCFSNYCIYWNKVINEIERCVNSTRPIKFDMRLSFKIYNKGIDEEMYHGLVSPEVLNELKEIAEKYTENNSSADNNQ